MFGPIQTPELFIYNLGFVVSILMESSIAVFVFAKNPRRPINVIFFLMVMLGTVYMISHVVGINLNNPLLSRNVLMLNLVVPWLVVLNAHWVLLITDRIGKQKRVLIALYVIATLLAAFLATHPDGYLKLSQPLFYFTNFYVRGPLFDIDILFYTGVIIYLFYHLFSAYRKADPGLQNRLWYSVIAFSCVYGIASIPILPTYGIQIDPWPSFLIGFWTVPMAYAIIKTNLMDIRIVAKRALVYLILVTASTTGLTIINWSNIFILTRYPNFPHWLIPLFSSIVGVGIAILVWNRLKETEVLKYEFINVITHKFRTPMTHIKYSVEELRSTQSQEMKTAAIDRIEIANGRLIELTNVLVEGSQSENSDYLYMKEQVGLNELIESVLHDHRGDIATKLVTIKKEFAPDLKPVYVDVTRTKSITQILLENAINYSRKGGVITIRTRNKERGVVFSIQDEGIGMTKEEKKLLFSKFYRAPEALAADTEGMGMGLFIARTIAENFGGKLYAESPGKNLGSTFFLELPAYRA